MPWIIALFLCFCFPGLSEASLLNEEIFYDVHPLTAGPRVGKVTDSYARLHGRGIPPASGTTYQTYLVARIAPYVSPSYAEYVEENFRRFDPHVCKPENDYCAMMTLDGLTSNRKYFYQLGSVEAPEGISISTPLRWEEASWGTFETDDPQSTDLLSFVFGSCRNYLRFFGLEIGLQAGDRTFGSILKQIEDGRPIDLFLMIGDQIYADINCRFVDWFYRAKTLAEFNKIHRTAFSTSNIKELMASTSTLMQEDDHLYRNNYTAEVAQTEPHIFDAVVKSFRNYQFHLGPEAPLSVSYWYTVSRKGTQFFFFDTRFERTRNKIISDIQWGAFSKWLKEDTKPQDLLFLVSPVPMICQENPDGWYGYPHQLAALTNLLIEEKRNPVILSGDAHASYSGQYKILKGNNPSVEASVVFTEVVSSGFYAYTHDDPENFKETVSLPEDGLAFSAPTRSPVRTQNLFTRITANRTVSSANLLVQVYAANGNLLDDLTYRIPLG